MRISILIYSVQITLLDILMVFRNFADTCLDEIHKNHVDAWTEKGGKIRFSYSNGPLKLA